MMRSFRAEWRKLRRPGMLLGAGGTIAGFAVLATLLIFQRAGRLPTTGRLGQRIGVTLAALAQADGVMRGFRAGAQFIGIVALVVFASNVASEYSLGTLRVLLSREPRRGQLLAGKLFALTCFMLLAITVAFVLSCALAFPLAANRGVDTAAWTTSAGMRGALGEYVNVAGAALGWAAIGATLGLLFRSTGAAIGAGLGWILPAEAIIVANWSDATQWLPGRSIEAFAVGGNADVAYQHAALVTVLYAAAFLTIAFAVFHRRDVTT